MQSFREYIVGNGVVVFEGLCIRKQSEQKQQRQATDSLQIVRFIGFKTRTDIRLTKYTQSQENASAFYGILPAVLPIQGTVAFW